MDNQESPDAIVGSQPNLLWQHKDAAKTRMYEFKLLIETKYNVKFNTYEDLRQWSIDNLCKFWTQVWDFTHVRASAPSTEVLIHVKLPKYALTKASDSR
jgi:hypothetical protein